MIDPTPNLFLVFATVLCVLVLKAQILAIVTALTRRSLMQFAVSEDADWLGGAHAVPDHPKARRVFRAHQNDLEALLPFFIGGALYLISGASEPIGMAYFIAFAAARLLHGFAYLTYRPALRRNAFFAGWLLNIVIAMHALVMIYLNAF